MSTAPPPEGASGRRGNGLASAEWGALVDLDPRLSEGLLDSLAAEGVAAYVEPARDIDSYTRATVLPKRPLDRLWVNPALADLARGVVTSEVADLTALLAEQEPGATAHGLVRPVPRTAAARVLQPPELPGPARTGDAYAAQEEQLPELPPVEPGASVSSWVPPVGGDRTLSDDELFAQIVAGFAQEVTDPVPRWPVAEDLSEDPSNDSSKDPSKNIAEEADEPSRRPPASRPRRRRTDTEDEGLPGWVEPAAVQDEGHYEPPPPPKLPRLRLRTVLANVMLLVGLTVLFAPSLIGLDDAIIVMMLGLLLTGGGAGLLVAWMRDAPPTDSGPDDGAVV